MIVEFENRNQLMVLEWKVDQQLSKDFCFEFSDSEESLPVVSYPGFQN